MPMYYHHWLKDFTDAVEENKEEITLWGTGNARRELFVCR